MANPQLLAPAGEARQIIRLCKTNHALMSETSTWKPRPEAVPRKMNGRKRLAY
jgi:hypothetical protein